MKIDRLMGILTTLLKNNTVTAPQLAEKFEVTRRTIGRDIEALCMAGIPVVTRQGGSGGISLAEGYRLDKSVLTRDELKTLLAALKGIGSVSGDAQVERLLNKLNMTGGTVISLKDNMIIDLSSHYKDSLQEKIAMIKDAIENTRLIAFDYYSDKGVSRRTIEPYCIVFQWAAWYVFGYCTDRQDYRLFKLNRLWNLAVLQETYKPRSIPSEKMDFTDRFPDLFTVVILCKPCARYLLIDAYGPNCYKEQADGSLLATISYTNRPYITSWILGLGDMAKVLEPIDLANEIRETAQKMFLQYGEQDI